MYMESETEQPAEFITELIVQKDNSSLANTPDSGDIVSSEVLQYILLLNLWGPGLVICVFGIVTNILNITTFIKQGVQDTVNISLLGLATSDLGSQIALFFTNICFIPGFNSLDFAFVTMDFMYLASWCRILFTRVTTLITAYITLERCICVVFPLSVKNIFTPKRTVLCLVSVYVSMFASVFPMFYTARVTWVFDHTKNKTLLGLSFIKNRNEIENVAFTTNNAIPTIAFFLVIVCTIVLVVNLKEKSKWRRKATACSSLSAIPDRDIKVVKMVILISTLFITCYFPGTATFIWMILDPEMRLDGQHVNLLFTVFSILFNLESINATLNVFIYLSMSSKFKNTFMTTFCINNKDKKQGQIYNNSCTQKGVCPREHQVS